MTDGEKDHPKQSEECSLITEKFMLPDDGIALSAVLEKPEAGRCPLVVHLHGFSSNKDKPHNVAACEAMREAGCATLRIDLYGHGESGGLFRDHTLYKWISNTLTALDWARRQAFVSSVFLSGHSQGGLVAALVAGMAPDLVRGVILRAPAFIIPVCAREGQMLGRSFDTAQIPDEIPLFNGLTLGGHFVRVAQTVHAEEAVDRFPGPALLIHGDEDDTVPLADSQAAAARYRRGEIVVIHGETHHFNQHPEQMKAAIRAWLERELKKEPNKETHDA